VADRKIRGETSVSNRACLGGTRFLTCSNRSTVPSGCPLRSRISPQQCRLPPCRHALPLSSHPRASTRGMPIFAAASSRSSRIGFSDSPNSIRSSPGAPAIRSTFPGSWGAARSPAPPHGSGAPGSRGKIRQSEMRRLVEGHQRAGKIPFYQLKIVTRGQLRLTRVRCEAVSPQPQVFCLVDDAHAAAPEFRHDSVMGKGLTRFRHAHLQACSIATFRPGHYNRGAIGQRAIGTHDRGTRVDPGSVPPFTVAYLSA
jgi:hypothetical protein